MPDDLAALIRDRRHELGLTQAELAERVGRAPSTIGSWETGRSRPADEATFEALVRVLDLDAIEADERASTRAPVVPAAEPVARSEPAPTTSGHPDPVPTEVVVPEPREGSVRPVRTDTDPLYRIRVVATIVAVVVLGWVFVVALGAAGDILGSITDTMLAPFRG